MAKFTMEDGSVLELSVYEMLEMQKKQQGISVEEDSAELEEKDAEDSVKPGDKIRIVKTIGAYGDYEEGDILTVKEVDADGDVYCEVYCDVGYGNYERLIIKREFEKVEEEKEEETSLKPGDKVRIIVPEHEDTHHGRAGVSNDEIGTVDHVVDGLFSDEYENPIVEVFFDSFSSTITWSGRASELEKVSGKVAEDKEPSPEFKPGDKVDSGLFITVLTERDSEFDCEGHGKAWRHTYDIGWLGEDQFTHFNEDIEEGDQVRIIVPEDEETEYLRSGITNDTVGTVESINIHGDVLIDFPGRASIWRGIKEELTVVEPDKLYVDEDSPEDDDTDLKEGDRVRIIDGDNRENLPVGYEATIEKGPIGPMGGGNIYLKGDEGFHLVLGYDVEKIDEEKDDEERLKPGDKIRVVNACEWEDYSNGDILTVEKDYGDGDVLVEEHDDTILSGFEYEKLADVPSEPHQTGDIVRIVKDVGGHPVGTIGISDGGVLVEANGKKFSHELVEIIAKAADRQDL